MRMPLVLLLATLTAGVATASPAQSPSRLVVLVRHAEAAGEPANDPPLTARGQSRALALAAALDAADIGAVVVSDRRRTALTAEPLTHARGLTPIAVGVAAGLEPHVAAVADSVRARPAGQAVLVVGHSNTIPAIIAALGGPRLPDLCHGQFASLFVLELRPGEAPRLLRATYGAPDAEDACAP